MSNLATKFAALRAKQELSKPMPLRTFLYIYSRARHDCYIEEFLGAKALIKYLGKPELPVKQYPEILNPSFSVPILLGGGYDSQQLACLLAEEGTNYFTEYRQIRNAIYFVMKELITEMY